MMESQVMHCSKEEKTEAVDPKIKTCFNKYGGIMGPLS